MKIITTWWSLGNCHRIMVTLTRNQPHCQLEKGNEEWPQVFCWSLWPRRAVQRPLEDQALRAKQRHTKGFKNITHMNVYSTTCWKKETHVQTTSMCIWMAPSTLTSKWTRVVTPVESTQGSFSWAFIDRFIATSRAHIITPSCRKNEAGRNTKSLESHYKITSTIRYKKQIQMYLIGLIKLNWVMNLFSFFL